MVENILNRMEKNDTYIYITRKMCMKDKGDNIFGSSARTRLLWYAWTLTFFFLLSIFLDFIFIFIFIFFFFFDNEEACDCSHITCHMM